MGALWPLVQFQQRGFMTLATATATQVQDKTSSVAQSQEGPGWRTDRSLPAVRAGRGSASHTKDQGTAWELCVPNKT